MRKLVILFIIPFFLASCSLSNVQYLYNKFWTNDNLSQKSANDKNKTTKNKTDSWMLDEETETWSEDEEVEKKEVEESSKVLSIEEQYCKSKWWKVVGEVCYATDEEWLVKCNVNVFYLDMCRDKSAKVEDWIVVSIPGYAKKESIQKQIATSEKEQKEKIKLEEEKQDETNWLNESIDISDSDKDEKTKYLVEKNIWNGFIFKEDDNNKYLYLNSKLISKLDKSSRILMNSSEDDDKIISFNVYASKTASSPSKTLYVDMESKSLTEKSAIKSDTQTGETTSATKNESDIGKTEVVKSDTASMTNSKSWKSGTYYISWSSLKLKTVDWEVKTIFTQSWIYDYELMLNKQIKVYYKWNDGSKEDKIINIP